MGGLYLVAHHWMLPGQRRVRQLPDECVDSVVTDPPYGLKFMGKHWDCEVPKVELWSEVLRVMKPGAHLLAFFGTRTYHRGVAAIQQGFRFLGFDREEKYAKEISAVRLAAAERGQTVNEFRSGQMTIFEESIDQK